MAAPFVVAWRTSQCSLAPDALHLDTMLEVCASRVEAAAAQLLLARRDAETLEALVERTLCCASDGAPSLDGSLGALKAAVGVGRMQCLLGWLSMQACLVLREADEAFGPKDARAAFAPAAHAPELLARLATLRGDASAVADSAATAAASLLATAAGRLLEPADDERPALPVLFGRRPLPIPEAQLVLERREYSSLLAPLLMRGGCSPTGPTLGWRDHVALRDYMCDKLRAVVLNRYLLDLCVTRAAGAKKHADELLADHYVLLDDVRTLLDGVGGVQPDDVARARVLADDAASVRRATWCVRADVVLLLKETDAALWPTSAETDFLAAVLAPAVAAQVLLLRQSAGRSALLAEDIEMALEPVAVWLDERAAGAGMDGDVGGSAQRHATKGGAPCGNGVLGAAAGAALGRGSAGCGTARLVGAVEPACTAPLAAPACGALRDSGARASGDLGGRAAPAPSRGGGGGGGGGPGGSGAAAGRLKRALEASPAPTADADNHAPGPILSFRSMSGDQIDLGPEQLERLVNDQFLTDQLVDFAILQLLHPDGGAGVHVLPRRHLFPSFYATKICAACVGDDRAGYEAVKRWTKKVDIFQHDFLLMPIHDEEAQHWLLAVILNPHGGWDKSTALLQVQAHLAGATAPFKVRRDQRVGGAPAPEPTRASRAPVQGPSGIVILDSLGRVACMPLVHQALVRWLACEWEDKGNAVLHAMQQAARACRGAERAHAPPVFTTLGFPWVHCKVPRQPNGIDCGLFTAKNVAMVLTTVQVPAHIPVRASAAVCRAKRDTAPHSESCLPSPPRSSLQASQITRRVWVVALTPFAPPACALCLRRLRRPPARLYAAALLAGLVRSRCCSRAPGPPGSDHHRTPPAKISDSRFDDDDMRTMVYI